MPTDEEPPRLAPSRRMGLMPGLHCWVTGANQVDLPKGLLEHDLGWIIGRYDRDFMIVCRDRRWVLDPRQFEVPCLYQARNEDWVPEWHRSVERYLRAKLEEYRAWPVTREILVGHRYSMIACLKWSLRRNGWEAADLPGDGYGE